MASRFDGPRAGGRIAIGAIALASAVGAIAVGLGPGEFTTYAGLSPAAAALFAGAGLVVIGSGLVLSLQTATLGVARLAVIGGFVWFTPVLVGWAGGPPLVRSVAMVAAGFAFPLLAHLVLAFPTGQMASRFVRLVVSAFYVEALISALGRAIFRDPFLDASCWSNCTDNVFLVRFLPGVTRAIELTDIVFGIGAALLLVLLCTSRLAKATGSARRAFRAVAVAGVGVGVTSAAYWIAVLNGPEDSVDPTFRSVFVAQAAAVACVGVALIWTTLEVWARRRSVRRIVATVGAAPPPGSLQSALARALNDPELRIAYWLPASGRYVDVAGMACEAPSSSPGRRLTSLVRDGHRLAVVDHAAAVSELEPELGAAVRLALDNERLHAEVLAQLDDLRASRARIVEAGDEARRRLERDLHDGAQQRLLALSYDLRVASAAALSDGDDETAGRLATATEAAQAALAELRDLAHGIYPAILAEAGVASAIETLADTAPLAVEIEEAAADRFAPRVEMAMYVAVSDAVDDAIARNASYVSLKLVREADRVVLYVADDGNARTSRLAHLADRVGALGGNLELSPTRMRAEMPCV